MATSDDDTFEESSGTADSTVSYKYAQIVVPDFEMDVTSSTGTPPTFVTDGSEQGTRITSGSSFLRLGSFPDITGTTPSGLANSVNLANIVADAASVAASETGDDPAPDDSGILRDDSGYVGDDNYLLGFADDTRYRDPTEQRYIAGQTCNNTTTARKQETQRLLSKGGWWDHSDGNRITTTAGDKVEVIQGNYKLVVLGHKDPTNSDMVGDNTSIVDMSGGNAITQGTDPESVVAEYAYKDGVWTTYQSETGNSTTSFTGNYVEYFAGSSKECYIGQDPGDLEAGDLDNIDKKTDSSMDPHIIEKTWASKIETYVGSDGKPVPEIFELRHAKAITETTFAAALNSVTVAAEITETRTGVVVDTVVGPLHEITAAYKFEVSLLKLETIDIKDVFCEEENEVTALKEEIGATKTALYAAVTRLMGQQTSLADDVVNLREGVADIDLQVTKVSGEVTKLQGEVAEIDEGLNVISPFVNFV